MGIRFLCPNGHKLNVKAFLSGKRAICPKCGARVVVPEKSELPDSKAQEAEEGVEVNEEPAVAAMPTSVVVQAVEGGGAAVAAATLVTPTLATPAALLSPAAGTTAVSTSTLANGGGPPQSTSTVGDPIAEAPSAVWYVRPPSGGQFGPAAADTMRAWLQEGRITGDSLVWRAGWPQWRSAASAFPQLSPGLAARPVASPVLAAASPAMAGASYGVPQGAMMAAPVMSLPVGQVVSAASDPLSGLSSAGDVGGGGGRRRRRRKHDITSTVVGVLIVMMVILVVVLVLVLVRNTENTPAEMVKPKLKSPSAAPESKSKAKADDSEKPSKSSRKGPLNVKAPKTDDEATRGEAAE